jgi:hypothetical protein
MARKSDFSALVGPDQNTNGFRSLNPNGVGRGGIGGDYEEQWNYEGGVNGEPWTPPNPVSDLVTIPTVRKSRR